MSFPKILGVFSVLLFGGIFLAALLKEKKSGEEGRAQVTQVTVPLEINLDGPTAKVELAESGKKQEEPKSLSSVPEKEKKLSRETELPDADRVKELFSTSHPQLPIVETISYTSRVPWLKGRSAWIADYATHYKTSRFFISRSLSGMEDYFYHSVANGDRFNIFRQDKNFNFHLLVDLSRLKMWFYYLDLDTNERVLLKTYPVGLGRLEEEKTSGSLTPLGTYELGNRVAIYKPGVMGYFNHRKTEMIRVFGTRWIPFEKEVQNCTAPAKGLGIHGLPWVEETKTSKLVEDGESIGKYESDGCIRLATKDIEELYSIIITQPTYIHLVADFFDAELPGEVR